MNLPLILTVSLSRFDFDYHKLERVKINSQFIFSNQLNGGDLMDGND